MFSVLTSNAVAMPRPTTFRRFFVALSALSVIAITGCAEESSAEGSFEGPRLHLGDEAPEVVRTVKVCPKGAFIDTVDLAELDIEIDAVLDDGETSTFRVEALLGAGIVQTDETRVSGGAAAAIDVGFTAYPGIGLREMCSQGVEVSFERAGASTISVDWRMFARYISGSEDISGTTVDFDVLE